MYGPNGGKIPTADHRSTRRKIYLSGNFPSRIPHKLVWDRRRALEVRSWRPASCALSRLRLKYRKIVIGHFSTKLRKNSRRPNTLQFETFRGMDRLSPLNFICFLYIYIRYSKTYKRINAWINKYINKHITFNIAKLYPPRQLFIKQKILALFIDLRASTVCRY